MKNLKEVLDLVSGVDVQELLLSNRGYTNISSGVNYPEESMEDSHNRLHDQRAEDRKTHIDQHSDYGKSGQNMAEEHNRVHDQRIHNQNIATGRRSGMLKPQRVEVSKRGRINLDRESMINGLIMTEILGKPKSMK